MSTLSLPLSAESTTGGLSVAGLRHLLLGATATLAVLLTTPVVQADTFSYDDAGRLLTAVQSTGLNHAYAYDEEANLLAISHTATDTTAAVGPGNGLPDWWENHYFGATNQNPLGQPASDGLSAFLKFTLGQNPQVASTGAALAKTFVINPDGNSYPTLTFVRAKDAAATLIPEQSLNGGAWQSGAAYLVTVSTTDLGDGTEQVIVRSLTPLPAAANLSFRLHATDSATGTTDATAPITAATGVPTLPGWSFNLLIALLLVVAVGFLRQKSQPSTRAAS